MTDLAQEHHDYREVKCAVVFFNVMLCMKYNYVHSFSRLLQTNLFRTSYNLRYVHVDNCDSVLMTCCRKCPWIVSAHTTFPGSGPWF